MIVDADRDISKYITNTIEYDSDRDSHILHQNIIKKQQGDTQVPLTFYTDEDEIQNLSIHYALKYPENLADILGPDGWAVLTEFKTTSDYRLALYVYADENKNLSWYMHGDNVVIDDIPYEEYWFQENFETAVPVGEWFDVDISWERSEKKD